MTQVEGIPYRRNGPSAALQDFLEPLLLGGYFDCGRARLPGIDDALLDEARRRGRDIGDDSFQLVACEKGLVFCRPSISFVISAPWDQLSIVRPRGESPAKLSVTWPKHGDLEFTLSKRLAANVFRRWLQLQMENSDAARRNHPSSPFGIRLEVSNDPETSEPAGAVRLLPAAPVAPQPPPSDTAMRKLVVAKAPDNEAVKEGNRDAERRSLLGSEPVIADDDLQRVVPPQPLVRAASASWVGSPVSLAAALVIISSAVLVIAVGVGLDRRDDVLEVGPDPAGPLVGVVDPLSTIDQQSLDQQYLNTEANATGPLASSAASESSTDAAGAANEDQVTLEPTGSELDLSVAPSDSGAAQSTTTVAPETPEPQTMTRPSGAEGALGCDRNYSGCVPPVVGLIAAPGVELDVDCDGRGDGPWMLVGEVLVLGSDIYGLDTDGDGLACEADQPDDREAEGTATVGTLDVEAVEVVVDGPPADEPAGDVQADDG